MPVFSDCSRARARGRCRSTRQLQVFNIELKKNVKSHMMNEEVGFWKWMSTSTLSLVTEKIFDRHANLAGAQIINYRATAGDKWLVLVGIAGNTTNPAAFRVKGAMQLYSRERGVSQAIEGHAVAFATIKLDGHPHPTKLFTFSIRTATGAKLHIVEIDHAEGKPAFQKKAVDVFFPPEATKHFPVVMQVSQQHGIIYLVTKYGFIHLYNFETAACIYMGRITPAPVSSHRARHRASPSPRIAHGTARQATSGLLRTTARGTRHPAASPSPRIDRARGDQQPAGYGGARDASPQHSSPRIAHGTARRASNRPRGTAVQLAARASVVNIHHVVGLVDSHRVLAVVLTQKGVIMVADIFINLTLAVRLTVRGLFAGFVVDFSMLGILASFGGLFVFVFVFGRYIVVLHSFASHSRAVDVARLLD
ncbi:clathrin heavy-chain terminal domain-containing protein [Auricularia subglabra TFB-10046 SS5]|nr:clathrin heavy-chain terminal domain-containing protein [Auricularia subglabra TFB-10046 SS5]